MGCFLLPGLTCLARPAGSASPSLCGLLLELPSTPRWDSMSCGVDLHQLGTEPRCWSLVTATRLRPVCPWDLASSQSSMTPAGLFTIVHVV